MHILYEEVAKIHSEYLCCLGFCFKNAYFNGKINTNFEMVPKEKNPGDSMFCFFEFEDWVLFDLMCKYEAIL